MVTDAALQTKVDPLDEGGVGQTSLLIAAWRARESERVDPLYVDPIANIFVTPTMAAWVEEVTQASVSTCELINYRTRYFDDFLLGEIARGVRQVVILGSGLDTRSLRLGSPDVTFYEVDCTAVLGYKQRQLSRHGYSARSRFIAANYIQDDLFGLLGDQGFDAGRETYFIWEGNTMYIPAEEILGLLRRLKATLPRFRISFDYLSDELIGRKTGFVGAKRLVDGFNDMGAPWVTGFADVRTLAEQAGLGLLENKWMVDVVAPSPYRIALSRDLFRHYSVCTLSSHE